MNILNTSKKFLKAGVCAIMLITAGQAQAQQVTVDASIDSLQLLIGEQAKVKLESAWMPSKNCNFRSYAIHW